ncbi:TetR/AcrR family transcriptional regulator [Nocardia sp. CDC160]|uniref:TetR/AcrR family transcriptional regulator n=1 Tax=Nocardia sp. CDC160 TaxID=3112166 RepID=UPI002DB6B336|nr:TetR family transcriptional regulator [Nocardia sp. CDC160]MEC3917894.1 TetR family transcriptional regulator [Nocardia sp. CDC160]
MPVHTDRTELILDATLRLIGSGGPQAVTHRSVAAEAGVSLGAITHHFKTRDVLVEQALRLLAQREQQTLDQLTLSLATSGFDQAQWVATVARYLADRTRAGALQLQATYELLLECARRPGLRDVMSDWTAAQSRLAVVALREAGSATPDAHAPLLIAAITGLLLKQLAYPRPKFETAILAPALDELLTRLSLPTPDRPKRRKTS